MLLQARRPSSISIAGMTRLLLKRAGPLAVMLMLVGCGALTQALAASGKPPKLPDCFKTGSGYGSCEGMVIPGGGSVAKVETANDGKDKFKFTGPAPLQSKDPVACGDAGCVYNHLDWSVGNGATVVSGCKTNGTECVVKVARRSPVWAVVYVRQNNNEKQLWAIWNSGKTDYEMSGDLVTACEGHSSCSTSSQLPIAYAPITVSGHKRVKTTTDEKGHWSVEVPNGSYVASPGLGGGYTVTPAKRRVKVEDRNETGVDFAACPASGRATARAAVTYKGKSDGKTCFNAVRVTYAAGAPTMTVFWSAAQVCNGSLAYGIGPISWLNNRPLPVVNKPNGVVAGVNGDDGAPALRIVINPSNGIGAVQITPTSPEFVTHPAHGKAGDSDFKLLTCHPNADSFVLRP